MRVSKAIEIEKEIKSVAPELTKKITNAADLSNNEAELRTKNYSINRRLCTKSKLESLSKRRIYPNRRSC